MRHLPGESRCKEELVVVCNEELSRKVRHLMWRKDKRWYFATPCPPPKAVPGRRSHLILRFFRPKDKIQFGSKLLSKTNLDYFAGRTSFICNHNMLTVPTVIDKSFRHFVCRNDGKADLTCHVCHGYIVSLSISRIRNNLDYFRITGRRLCEEDL